MDSQVKRKPLLVECPHCWSDNHMDVSGWDDIDDVGKHVMECEKCKKLFVVRDEGEGLFITF